MFLFILLKAIVVAERSLRLAAALVGIFGANLGAFLGLRWDESRGWPDSPLGGGAAVASRSRFA